MAILVDDFAELLLVIYSKNSHVDRAKSVLTEILEELDANRNRIYGDFEPSNGRHAIANVNGLFLIIDYFLKKLQVDARQIRDAWKNQRFKVLQKNNDKKEVIILNRQEKFNFLLLK